MEKLTLVVSLETNDEQVADVYQVEDGRWMVTTTCPIPRADLTRMLMAAGALVPMLPAADDASERALRQEVETLNAQCAALKLNEEVMRQQARVNADRATELRTALDMERAGAASLLAEAGAQPGETLRNVVLGLKHERDIAIAQNERLRTSNDNMLHALGDRMEERNTARQDVERLTGEVARVSDMVRNEHQQRLAAEATLERIRSRCTPMMTTMLEGTQGDNPLEDNVLDWGWTDDRTGTVVLLKRDA